MITALRRRIQLWVDTKAEEMTTLADDMRTIIERTDPNDWDEMWAWIDGEWKRVRKVEGIIAWPDVYIVEEYEQPGKMYQVLVSNCRRGEKPDDPPNVSIQVPIQRTSGVSPMGKAFAEWKATIADDFLKAVARDQENQKTATDLNLIIGPRVPAFDQPPITDVVHLGVPWQLTAAGVTVTLVWRNDDPPTLQIGIERAPEKPTEPPERLAQ